MTSVAPDEVEELLGRLAALAEEPAEVVDLYERQVSRAKAPADQRSKALPLGRRRSPLPAGQLDRARGFFDIALGGTPSDEALAALEKAATDADALEGSVRLRRVLCDALAGAGQGARDGGRTRGSMLRRAASIARRDLDDLEQAFAWLGEALVAHVESPTLDALEALAREEGDLRRAETTLSRALEEVFDGPLVRQLLARRAKLRRDDLDDAPGAAIDLKKLHDLSPSDQGVVDELSALLTKLGDYRGLVQLFEDQILRGKDVAVRVDLARKVARMWEEELSDPREAADAWRRVLRLKAGDPDATAGLERAKSNMLKRPDPVSEPHMVAPPSQPPAAAPPSKRHPAEPVIERMAEPPGEEPVAEPEPPAEPEPAAEVSEASAPEEPEAEAPDHEPRGPLDLLAHAIDEQDEKPTVPPPARSAEITETLTDPLERNGPSPLSAAATDEGMTADADDPSGEDVSFDDELEPADDMIVEVEEKPALPPEDPKKGPIPKRSIPPPLPRG